MCSIIRNALLLLMLSSLGSVCRVHADAEFFRLRSSHETTIQSLTRDRLLEWVNSAYPAEVVVERTMSLTSGRWVIDSTQTVQSASSSHSIPPIPEVVWTDRTHAFTTHQVGLWQTAPVRNWVLRVFSSGPMSNLGKTNPYYKFFSKGLSYVEEWYRLFGDIVHKEDDLALFLSDKIVDTDSQSGLLLVPYGESIWPVGYTLPRIVIETGDVQGTRHLDERHNLALGLELVAQHELITESELQLLNAPYFVRPKTAFELPPGYYGFNWGNKGLTFHVLSQIIVEPDPEEAACTITNDVRVGQWIDIQAPEANEGWRFVEWEDGRLQLDRSVQGAEEPVTWTVLYEETLAPEIVGTIMRSEPVVADYGEEVTFSVEATGTEPLYYEWFREETSLSDNATLSVVATAETEGEYRVVVSNDYGEVSRTVDLFIRPNVINPPFNVHAHASQDAFFSVRARGSTPLHYQWLHNGVQMDNQTGSNLVVNASNETAGDYTVIVTNAHGSTTAPATLNLLPAASARIITFAGREWRVSSGFFKPGPNHWCDSEESVRVCEETDTLYLKIRYKAEWGAWTAAQIVSEEPTVHGMHRFYVEGRLDTLDRNAVFSPFLYNSGSTREVDIEFSRWGNPDTPVGWYVVYLDEHTNANEPFDFVQTGLNTTHYLDWQPGGIHFRSFHGHYPEPPDPMDDYQFGDWFYDGPYKPPADAEMRIILNLWMQGADHDVFPPHPHDGQEIEIAVRAELPVPAPPGMVPIPGGTNSGTDPDFGAYSLTVDSFYMDKYEVTKAKWDEVYTWSVTNGYSFDHVGSGKAASHPVQTVSWYDVVKWCNARSQKEGRPAVYTVGGAVYKTGQSDNVVQTSASGYRLPTDVEWEYAARGGLSDRRFPWGYTITHSNANYYSWSGDSYDISPTRGYHPTYNDGTEPYTSPARSFAANRYGLYDMAGNVSEWCFDWMPGSEGVDRVLRGGGWWGLFYDWRVGYRNIGCPPDVSNYIGFRSVLFPDP